MRYPEFENRVFSGWFVSVCVNLLTAQLKRSSKRKLKFSTVNVLNTEMLLKAFYEDLSNNLCTGACSEFKYIGAYGFDFILVYLLCFDSSKRDKIKIQFPYIQLV